MIEFIVLIILIIFAIYMIAVLAKSLILFVVNVSLIWVVFTKFFIDWKKKEMRIYYFVSALLVVFSFILKDYFFAGYIFNRLTEVFVVETVQILLLTFISAHLLFWIGNLAKRIIK